jgi:hypothetical protein
MESRLHASHEGQLDLIASVSCIRAEIPATRNLGTILQFSLVLHWHLYQLRDQEEAHCGIEEAVREN